MNYEQRHPVRRDGELVECNYFLDLLQICVQSLKNGSIYRILEIKTVSIDLPDLSRN